MLSLVTAAEHQYRHDTWTRERELAVLTSIRERRASEAIPTPVVAAPVERPAPVAQAPALAQPAPAASPAARARRAWARPIGLHAPAERAAVCATA